MSESLLAVLRLCLLALLYLFFLRVLWAVWTEVRVAGPVAGQAAPTPSGRRSRGRKASAPAPPALLVVEPTEHAGRRFDLGEEITIGRAAGCHVTLDDTFVSQLHARVFRRDGRFLVEDLGSTNGTYLNRQRVTGPLALRHGDRLQVGNTVLEMT